MPLQSAEWRVAFSPTRAFARGTLRGSYRSARAPAAGASSSRQSQPMGTEGLLAKLAISGLAGDPRASIPLVHRLYANLENEVVTRTPAGSSCQCPLAFEDCPVCSHERLLAKSLVDALSKPSSKLTSPASPGLNLSYHHMNSQPRFHDAYGT
jgi:hypothetical protein